MNSLCPLLIFVLLNNLSTEIYEGKKFPWEVYFDSERKDFIAEVYGIKYGYLDRLKESDSHDERGSIAYSKDGCLYKNKDGLFYSNKNLGIKIKLERKKYTDKIDNKRLKIFATDAFMRISHLKDSLQAKHYEFDWNVKEDFLYFKMNSPLTEEYQPNYIKKFYSEYKRDNGIN